MSITYRPLFCRLMVMLALPIFMLSCGGEEGSTNKKGYTSNIEGQVGVNVVAFGQTASTDAMSLEAATNAVHQSGQVQEYEWDPVSGDGVTVTTSTEDYVETSQISQSANYHQLSLRQETSVPVGVSASAEITTQTSHKHLDFSVVGELSLDASVVDDLDPKHWAAIATAKAEWSMAVAIRNASIVRVENCDLFNQVTWTQYPDFQREAETCSFRINGSSNFESPDMPGLPKISIDPTTIKIDDEHEESKRLLDLVSGQIVTFQLDVNHIEEVSFSPSDAEGVRKESFAIYIRPDIDAQLDK